MNLNDLVQAAIYNGLMVCTAIACGILLGIQW